MMQKISRFMTIIMGMGLILMATMAFMPKSIPQALPPRPEPNPVVVEKSSPDGAQIQLAIANATGNEWTQVQWQDTQTAVWHNVDGWAGHADNDGTVTWWVAKEDLGSTPFRWQVYDEQGGELLTTSETFDLPSHALTRVKVAVSLP